MLDTIKQKLPYQMHIIFPLDGGNATQEQLQPKVSITNTRGQVLVVSRDQITRQLSRDDLDVHRRKMYEAARDLLRQAR